jgi:hypothetical protein
MRQDFFQFSPTHKFFLAGNHKPRIALAVGMECVENGPVSTRALPDAEAGKK